MTHQRQDEYTEEDMPHEEKGEQGATRAVERARQHVLGSDGRRNRSSTFELCQLSHRQTLCHVTDSWGIGARFGKFRVRADFRSWAAEGDCQHLQCLSSSHLQMSSTPKNEILGQESKRVDDITTDQ